MSNSNKNLVKRAKEKELKEKIQLLRKKISDNAFINIMCSLGMLVLCILCIIISFVTKSEEDSGMGLLLAMISLFVTLSFEIYEWIKLFSKKKIISTIPFVFSYILIIVLTVIKMYTNLWNAIFDYTNVICSGTLIFYIILTTIRSIYSNITEIKSESNIN